jgi:membrane associated rhomboid family serine protease
VVRESVVENFAVSHDTLNPFRLISAMFLHGSLLHLLGNMLFLWIFGAAAEDRLRPLKFLALYFIAGIGGGLLHDAMVGVAHPKQFGLGASGAIMGVAGMYLYLFPFAQIRVWVGWGWWRFFGDGSPVMDWQAQWVILYFVFFDLLDGFLFRTVNVSDGVAHFAHLGGFGLGFLCVLALRERRDSEAISEAQAVRADIRGDHRLLRLHDLDPLIEREPENVELILTYCQKALRQPEGGAIVLCRDMLLRKSACLLERADPEALTRVALSVANTLPASFLLRLGGRLESAGAYADAETTYRRVLAGDAGNADAELALARLARLLEKIHPDPGVAAGVYTELLKRYPDGPQALFAKTALAKIGAKVVPFVAHGASEPVPVALPAGMAPVQARSPHAEARKPDPEPAPPMDNGLRPIGG